MMPRPWSTTQGVSVIGAPKGKKRGKQKGGVMPRDPIKELRELEKNARLRQLFEFADELEALLPALEQPCESCDDWKQTYLSVSRRVKALEQRERELCEIAEKWSNKAIASREESGRIRRTVHDATEAEANCLVRAEVWDDVSAELRAALNPTEQKRGRDAERPD